MPSWHNESIEQLCRAILTLRTSEECSAFLEDICTIREIQDIAQRLAVARMLQEGKSYNVIRSATGASSATISRVSRCCEYGAGGYRTVIRRMNQEESHD